MLSLTKQGKLTILRQVQKAYYIGTHRPLACFSTMNNSMAEKRYPNEPTQPTVKTAFPGPETLDYIKHYANVSCEKQIQFPVDLHNSIGNYVSDADGN